MSAITITLPEEYLVQLTQLARQMGLVPEDLVRVSIEELLRRPEEEFLQSVDHVLTKNAGLYQRLA